MGGFSLWHWLIVGIVILLLFGKGRFSNMMGDVAEGLKSFKKGLADDDAAAAASPPGQARIEQQPAPHTPVPTLNGEEISTDRRA